MTSLPKFTHSANHRHLLTILFSVFLVCLLFGLHGFSVPLFRDIIDGSSSTELLLGRYQWVRGDEWSMTVPNALAQLSHSPKFPEVNQNIGLGQNMLVYPQMPVLHFFTVFRPSLWGFFLGPDTGLAWQWWFRALGLLYSFFLLFMLVSENQFRLSLLGSLAFLFSPFIQFWSLNAAEMLIPMALSVVLATSLLSTTRPDWERWLQSLALWWLGTNFALTFYPAFQIPLVYTALGLVASLTWLKVQRQGVPTDLAKRLIHLGLVAGLILGTVALFYFKTSGPVEIMRHTVYPGLRHEIGGGESAVLFFSNFVNFFHHGGVYRLLKNICEASSFLFFFPLCVAASLLSLFFVRNRQLLTLLPLLAVLCFLLVWMFLGFPEPLPSWTLLKYVPDYRAKIAIGVINAIFIVAYLSETFRVDLPQWLKSLLLAGWSGFLLYQGRALQIQAPELPLYVVHWSCLVITAVSGLILFRHRWAGHSLFVISLILTLSFNPVVRGGTRFLLDNPLSQEMKRLDQQEGGRSRWLVFGSQQLGNLPRILGLKSLSGQYFYPQLELWKKLDPIGKYAASYNRYAQTEWRVLRGTAITMEIQPPAILFVHIDPTNEVLRRLSVKFFLVEGAASFFREQSSSFELVFSYANKHIFRYREPDVSTAGPKTEIKSSSGRRQ